MAISNILDSKKFLLGDEPTTIDCTLLGHLAQFLFIDIGFPQKKFLDENCGNVVEYVDRMLDRFWPDWKEQCDTKCMAGRIVH